MLEVDENLVISISHGDLLDITFNVNGIELDAGGEVYLTVKENWKDETPCLVKQCSRICADANKVRVIIPSAEMKKLKVGKYFYDLAYTVGGNKRTLNYPARFIVREVVNDA